MKPGLFIPPLLALTAVGIWLASQHHTLSTLRAETENLRVRISSANDPTAASSSHDGETGANAPIDWQKTARLIRLAGNSSQMCIRENTRLKMRIGAMTAQQIVAAIDEIEGMDLNRGVRVDILGLLALPLSQKDPQLALDHLVGATGDATSYLPYVLSEGLAQWVAKDQPAATRWLDEQIAAGKLVGKSLDDRDRIHLQFEASLIPTLIEADPLAAGRRLDALTLEQRKNVINSASTKLTTSSSAFYATLVRSHLAESDQFKALAQPAARIAMSAGHPAVEDYLHQISATPLEREAILKTLK
jgi:hypothetical protein